MIAPFTCTSPKCDCSPQPGGCRARPYAEQRAEIEAWEPNGWDLSSSIAFRMFARTKAYALEALDDAYHPPSHWQRFKRRWGLRW